MMDGSTLDLKPMGTVNRSLKRRAPVAQQNGDLSPQRLKKSLDAGNLNDERILQLSKTVTNAEDICNLGIRSSQPEFLLF